MEPQPPSVCAAVRLCRFKLATLPIFSFVNKVCNAISLSLFLSPSLSLSLSLCLYLELWTNKEADAVHT